jgi:acetyl/propionyl-CoA carboxylase alpha subunit
VTVERIDTLLVANRGEIACRVIEAAHDLGLRAVAVYAEPDRSAPHVHRADVAVSLEGTTATETYLDGAKVLGAATLTGADAIHPGYGFLSENAAFARAVIDSGLTWVGPHPEAIARMGDKLAAKALAAQLALPLLTSAPVEGDDPDEWATRAATVGYPLLVKAAAGGGGRGMRLVMAAADLADAVVAARREALDSFGDDTVFVESWLASPRHVEVQVIADQHGHRFHLGERECSIQRRHQKLIEEAPSPAVDGFLREQLGDAALRLAEAIDYDSVGTVEFLLDAERNEFFFLEMNTRLQVEHRVTEEVTGFDLVELQLRAAMGEAFDFDQDEIDIEGHAIEARLVAEDPANGWLPSTGVLHRFDDVDDFHVRCDSGVNSGSVVSPHFDSLLAKFIATGDTREEAKGRLVRALLDSSIHGVTTNRDHLVAVLRSEDFTEGRTTTAFLDLHLTLLDARPDDWLVASHLVAVVLWAQHVRRRRDDHWGGAPSGWRNVRSQDQSATFTSYGRACEVTYLIEPDDRFTVNMDGSSHVGRVVEWMDDRLRIEIGRTQLNCRVNRVDDTWYVNSRLGQTEAVERPRFPPPSATIAAGGLTAPVPGRVVSVAVAIGDLVVAGQTLVVMEAMKVEHRIDAPGEGKVVDVLVEAGRNVDAHQVLVRLEPVS